MAYPIYKGKYLDPKADLTFKKIFGNHPDLLKSLLNALLPLSSDQQIDSIEYLPVELVPETPLHKDTIVDVRCKDIRGRQFLVEMQMSWTNAFRQRVLFNASKAYVSQAEKGLRYGKLQPVYSLNLVNEIFEPSREDFIFNYDIVCDKATKRVIEGLHFTFIELPKFKPQTIREKKMTVLWLKFLTEIDTNTREVPSELLDNPETSKALDELEVSAFSEEELRTYDKFWDRVSSEMTLMEGKYEEGLEKGLKTGLEKGLEKGKAEEKTAIAKNLLSLNVPLETVMQATGLTREDVVKLK